MRTLNFLRLQVSRGHDTPFRRRQQCDKIYPGQSNSSNKACVSVGSVVFAVVWVLVRVVVTQDGFCGRGYNTDEFVVISNGGRYAYCSLLLLLLLLLLLRHTRNDSKACSSIAFDCLLSKHTIHRMECCSTSCQVC